MSQSERLITVSCIYMIIESGTYRIDLFAGGGGGGLTSGHVGGYYGETRHLYAGDVLEIKIGKGGSHGEHGEDSSISGVIFMTARGGRGGGFSPGNTGKGGDGFCVIERKG